MNGKTFICQKNKKEKMTCVVTIDDILIKRSHFKGVIEIKRMKCGSFSNKNMI